MVIRGHPLALGSGQLDVACLAGVVGRPILFAQRGPLCSASADAALSDLARPVPE